MLDRIIRTKIRQYHNHLFIGFIIFISLLIRISLLGHNDIRSDYNDFLIPWCDFYRRVGIVKGLRDGVGNYYIPYNVFLAMISQTRLPYWLPLGLLSITFEYLSVFCLYKILALTKGTLSSPLRMLASLTILFVPVSFLNSSLWKQCDSIYTFFLLAAVLYILRENYTLAMIMLSISFVFKQQAIFFFPFFIMVYLIKDRFHIYNIIFFPLIYLIAGLPAIICGREAMEVYTIYQYQLQGNLEMYSGLPNISVLGLIDYDSLFHAMILTTIIIFTYTAYFIYHNASVIDKNMLISLSIWCVYTCCMFLPTMHERYDYYVVLYLTVYAIVYNRKMIPSALLINIVSVINYTTYFFGEDAVMISMNFIAPCYMAAYLWFTYCCYRSVSLKKKSRKL
ncbi:hypothetical protein [Butyrivibrio sp. INlla16]|uniref:hypothetical protein n=1 Tax=Butyrivibrio sp. INlla16 TaxID=1520807 RepID=UPI00087F9876|nr:hypothetical protein [Butyrivibrio sp. INlla16]SDB45866.1 Mannosyltransferase related to Gpi18 [Butyrivibrio sp. INlla16]